MRVIIFTYFDFIEFQHVASKDSELFYFLQLQSIEIIASSYPLPITVVVRIPESTNLETIFLITDSPGATSIYLLVKYHG